MTVRKTYTTDGFSIDVDDLWPRDGEHRYRLYAVVGDDRKVLAAAASLPAIGQAIETLHDDAQQVGRRLGDEGRIGILDVLPGGKPSPRGEWIVSPFDRSPA